MKTKGRGLLLILLFAVFTGSAQQTDRFKGTEKNSKSSEFKQMHAENMGEKSFLSEEQKKEMKAFMLERIKEAKPLKDELRELEAHHITLTTADNADLDVIYSNIDKIAKVKAELAKIKAKNHQKIRSILTEEQLLKFDAGKGNMKYNPSFKHGKEREERRQEIRFPERG